MKLHGAFYFLGKARPAHFEADSIKALRAKMFDAIRNTHMDDWQFFAFRIDQAAKELRKKGCAGFSSEHGTRGLVMQKRPHDPWLDKTTADLAPFPGLDYSKACNA